MRFVAPSLVFGLCFISTLVRAETPAEMEPMTWLAVPDSKMQAVQSDPILYADLQGNGFWTIVGAWNGAVLDTTRLRLVVWGGGHNDYYGNDMYAFDIGTLAWSRLTDPTVDWTDCGDPNPDGTANSRHTYNGLSYIEHADRMFVSGGALNCYAGGCGGDLTWEFDFDALAWNDRQPTGSHTTGCGDSSAYDPASGLVYFGDANGLFAYSHDDNAWTQKNADSFYQVTSTIDTTRNQLVVVGNGEVWSYDLAGDFTRETWTTTGGDAFIAGAAVGLAYDPTTDRIVGWADGPVMVLDPESREWTSYDVPGAPAPSINGTYGRWRYVPDVNAFILVTGVDVDVHFFKLSDGGMLPPPGGDESSTSAGDGADSDDGDVDTTAGTAPGTDDGVDPSATADPTNATVTTATGSEDDGAATDDDAASGCGCTSAPAGVLPLWTLAIARALRSRRRS